MVACKVWYWVGWGARVVVLVRVWHKCFLFFLGSIFWFNLIRSVYVLN